MITFNELLESRLCFIILYGFEKLEPVAPFLLSPWLRQVEKERKGALKWGENAKKSMERVKGRRSYAGKVKLKLEERCQKEKGGTIGEEERVKLITLGFFN